jgi:hypothetical protein
MATFKNLWANYPDDDPCDAKNDKGEKLFSNQCAIRLSHSMNKPGCCLAPFLQSENAGFTVG